MLVSFSFLFPFVYIGKSVLPCTAVRTADVCSVLLDALHKRPMIRMRIEKR